MLLHWMFALIDAIAYVRRSSERAEVCNPPHPSQDAKPPLRLDHWASYIGITSSEALPQIPSWYLNLSPLQWVSLTLGDELGTSRRIRKSPFRSMLEPNGCTEGG